jgi:hypothetical protein
MISDKRGRNRGRDGRRFRSEQQLRARAVYASAFFGELGSCCYYMIMQGQENEEG